MFKRVVRVLREQHIGQVMCGIYVVFALRAIGATFEASFRGDVIHFFNTHTKEFPQYEPPISALEIGLKSYEVVLFSVLALLFYRWFMPKQGEISG